MNRFLNQSPNLRASVCYDEQHPKKGHCQKYRLTLFDPKTQRPLADELFDDKSSETIKNFLKKHLDTSEPVFIVTDFDKRYPEILSEVFGDKLVHQYCLMHLNKLVVHDFPRKTTIEQELSANPLISMKILILNSNGEIVDTIPIQSNQSFVVQPVTALASGNNSSAVAA